MYLFVLFLLHPMLGFAAIFACIQGLLVWFGHRQTVAPSAASKASSEAGAYLHSKLRNAEVLESTGMVHNLHPHWADRHAHALAQQGRAQALSHRITAWSKFIRYAQQSLALGLARCW